MPTPSDRRKAYTCGFHPERGEQADFCPACIQEHETRLSAESMTGDERAAELSALLDRPLSRPFDLIHKRIEELAGRSVWTHEIGLNSEGLVEEARNRPRDTPLMPAEFQAKVMAPLEATGKPIIGVVVDEPEAKP
jgi:hypothetical protein